MNKDIILQRIFDNGESTIGYCVYDDRLMYTLEDTFRVDKLRGLTRISSGRYKLGLRLVESGKTKAYRKKYSWFDWHIQLEGIENFQYIYMHIGNYAKDSDGCILVGTSPTNNYKSSGLLTSSTIAFKEFYQWLFPKLSNGEEIYIQVRDEIHREDTIKEQIKLQLK